MKKLLGFLTLSLATSVAFAEDAYLESDGTQYVPINYYANPQTRIVADFTLTASAGGTAIFGSWDKASSVGTRIGLWINGSGNVEATLNGKYTGGLQAGTVGVRFWAEVDAANRTAKLVSANGSVQKPFAAVELATDVTPLFIFGDTETASGATGRYQTKAKIYWVKIYEGDELKVDLVPSVKGGTAGFYDEKSGSFYASASAKPLAAGGEGLKVLEDDPYVAAPEGNVSVITDYLMTPTTKIEADFTYLQTTDTQQFIFEAGDSAKPYGRVYLNGSRNLSCTFDDTPTYVAFDPEKDGTSRLPVVAGVRLQVSLDSNQAVAKRQGVIVATSDMTVYTRTKTPTQVLRLLSNSNGDNNWGKVRLYGFKIYDNDILVHDYRPMKHEGEGVLWDAVTGLFLTSATSTKLEFGGPVKEVPYVESTGNQVVTLDYYTGPKSVLELEYSNLDKAKNNDKRIFGTEQMHFRENVIDATKGIGGNCEAYMNGVWSGSVPSAVTDGKLHTIVLDAVNGKLYYTDPTHRGKGAASLATKSGYKNPAPSSVNPMMLFHRNNGALVASGTTGTVISGAAACRIYVANVYEEGKLIHSYRPYVKDGRVGFKDAKTDKFFPGLLSSGTLPVGTLSTGGAIAHEGALPEAYIESDQTQMIRTDYKPTVNTRIELDYQLTKLVNDFYLIGAHGADANNDGRACWSYYVNGNYGYTFIAHSRWSVDRQTTQTALMADQQRTKLILDRPADTAQIVRADTTKSYTLKTAATGKQEACLGIFARNDKDNGIYPTASTTVTGGTVKMRVYSLRIYEKENGEYVLKREYLPWDDGVTVGLKETLSGQMVASGIGGNPFVIGGVGYTTASGAVSTFETALAGDVSVAAGGSATFGPVFAPGAIRYEWTRGGVPLAETGDTVTLGWQRLKGDYAQEISVTPVYNVYGTEVKGEPSTATLTNEPLGMAILIR